MGKNAYLTGVSLALSTLCTLAALSPASALGGASTLEGASTPAGFGGKEADSFDTGKGELRITFLGHASLVFELGGEIVYIDPVKQYGDFAAFPKADLILVTHEHGDHLDAGVIAALAVADVLPKIPW